MSGETNDTPCPVCGTDMTNHLDGTGVYAHCAECGHVCVNPDWSVDWIDDEPEEERGRGGRGRRDSRSRERVGRRARAEGVLRG